MAAIGGDITEVRYSHPTLGPGVFFAKAGETSTLDLGGVRSNDETSGIDGSGEPVFQLTNTRGSMEMVVSNDDKEREDLFKAIELAGSPIMADWTMLHSNGTIYGMSGKPVGDLNGDLMAATFTLKVSGTKVRKIQ